MSMQATNILPLRREIPPTAAPLRETPLASLAMAPAGPLSGRFCAWRGASDQRYVASVYPADRGAADLGLPDFEAFVLISVSRGALGRRVVAVAAIERPSHRRIAVAAGLLRGAEEWHVHFLAEDRAARSAMVADLLARHGASDAACCA